MEAAIAPKQALYLSEAECFTTMMCCVLCFVLGVHTPPECWVNSLDYTNLSRRREFSISANSQNLTYIFRAHNLSQYSGDKLAYSLNFHPHAGRGD